MNFDASETNDLTRFMSSLEFIQIIGRATHLDGHILDQIYVPKTKLHLVESKHHYVYYSDHDGIIVSLKDNVTE